MHNNNFTLLPEGLAINEPDEELLKVINNKTFDDKVLFNTESAFHDISVVENEIGRFLHYKDTYQAGFINTEFYKGNLPYINYFLLPYLLKKDVKNILLIGFGTGKIVKDFEYLFENLEKITAVDIEENILNIAEEYFGFKNSEKFEFILQDGIAFLRNSKTKYDLIVVDVANNNGIESRFFDEEYLDLIKKSLKKGGIFVSNLCASPDLENPKNVFFAKIKKMYSEKFKHLNIFKGDYSDKVYYKSFFGIDKRVIDVTNIIIIASDSYLFDGSFTLDSCSKEKIGGINVDIEEYLNDLSVCN